MGATPPLRIIEKTGSTNDDALALGRMGAAAGTAVAARRQTAGRGRRGHVWESPVGNLYLSVVLRPETSPSRLPGLAAACGLGVLDGFKELGIANEAQLKWPNDVLARDRKLGGILVEAARDKRGKTFAVCGVGINLESAPHELGGIGLTELGSTPPFSVLAEALRGGIMARVDAWAGADGLCPLDGIREDYLAHLAWLGEKVAALSLDGEPLASGTFETVDPWGRAVIDAACDPQSFSAEQASLRPA